MTIQTFAGQTFAGKRALVTGAASGIGAASARWLATQGVATMVLVDLDAAGLTKLDLPCEVLPYPGSVADEALWSLIEDEAGPIDYAGGMARHAFG
jgi:NADP-dependent 3-hydroxy acid dehydrogenase YdfG